LSASLTVLLFNKIIKHKNDYLNLRNSREERRGEELTSICCLWEKRREEKSGIGWETLTVWELKGGMGSRKVTEAVGMGFRRTAAKKQGAI
jgi:hypothetical protein